MEFSLLDLAQASLSAFTAWEPAGGGPLLLSTTALLRLSLCLLNMARGEAEMRILMRVLQSSAAEAGLQEPWLGVGDGTAPVLLLWPWDPSPQRGRFSRQPGFRCHGFRACLLLFICWGHSPEADPSVWYLGSGGVEGWWHPNPVTLLLLLVLDSQAHHRRPLPTWKECIRPQCLF